MPYIQSVHAGLDVPDNRFDASKGSVKVTDVIAMSCGTHTYLIGQGVDSSKFDFGNARLTVSHDGEVVYDGIASNVMGDPRPLH